MKIAQNGLGGSGDPTSVHHILIKRNIFTINENLLWFTIELERMVRP
jgi:hypothetical protein